MFVGATTGGWFSDRMGRKRALVVTTVWYSAFSLMNAFAWNVPSLYATRLLTGVGLSAMTVVAMTYISEMFPARSRGAYPGVDPDDRPVRHSRDGLRRAIPHPDGVLGLAGRVRVGRAARSLFPLFAHRLEESPRWFEHQGRRRRSRRRRWTRIERARAARRPASCRRVPDGWTRVDRARPGGVRRDWSGPGRCAAPSLLIAIWIFQTLGIYGFLTWVPTLLVEHGFSIVRSLEQVVGDVDRRGSGRVDRREDLGSVGAQDRSSRSSRS